MVRLLPGHRPPYSVKLNNQVKGYWHYRGQRYRWHFFLDIRNSCTRCSTTPKQATLEPCKAMDRQRSSVRSFISYVILKRRFFFLQF